MRISDWSSDVCSSDLFLGVHPLIANVLAYLLCVAIGYLLHSRWSFRGHGGRDNVARRTSRFFLVSLVSFGLNSVFVWILTGPLLDGPTWWPVVPMLFVTPFVTFPLNSRWVFARWSKSNGASRLRPHGGARQTPLVVAGATGNPGDAHQTRNQAPRE